jgi:hypothetical protein
MEFIKKEVQASRFVATRINWCVKMSELREV